MIKHILSFFWISTLEFYWDPRSKNHDRKPWTLVRIDWSMSYLLQFSCKWGSFPWVHPRIFRKTDDDILVIMAANEQSGLYYAQLCLLCQLSTVRIVQNLDYPPVDSRYCEFIRYYSCISTLIRFLQSLIVRHPCYDRLLKSMLLDKHLLMNQQLDKV